MSRERLRDGRVVRVCEGSAILSDLFHINNSLQTSEVCASSRDGCLKPTMSLEDEPLITFEDARTNRLDR